MLSHIIVFILGACVCAVLQHKTEHSDAPPMLPRNWLLSVIFGLAGLGVMKLNDSLKYGFSPAYIWHEVEAPEGYRLRWGRAGEINHAVFYNKDRESLIGVPEGAIYLHYDPFYDDGTSSEGGD